MILLSVDPDVTSPGLALFVDGLLVRAGRIRARGDDTGRHVSLVATADVWAWPCLVDRVVIEWPKIYRAGRGGAADPNDLIELAAAAIAVACAFPNARHERMHARDWKGTLPKPETAADPYLVEDRVWERLSPVERVVWGRDVEPLAPTPRLEVTDAVGIGLHSLGRGILSKRRVLPR